ncbi:scavenger receptor cysteine-rich type 1 protein M160-like [Patiria miniata]|uniref:SRCR domain-containing protein n=1 Tax=Patiria miniata TaxID=46514 RepID=A0A913ZSA7_PATMI|nr:scavenger receptor cysteine-rich type 1 protein M160-like [Patiria miniata]
MGLRLADGRYPNEGRVEVLPPGEDSWGTYCSNENPFLIGRVACRQLGFPALLSATASGEFGKATGPIWFQLMICGELQEMMTLDDCLMLGWVPYYEVCDHRFDVGLTCFTGNLRLVGGRRESEGRVELHVGGDEWMLLSSRGGANFMYSDSVCQYLGYQFSVGVTQEPAVNNNQKILCSFSACPIDDGSRGFFQCLDELSLHFCPDKNITLLGAVCATENDILPSDASVEYRLGHTSNGSQYMGIVEARYNGSTWATLCLQVVNEYRAGVVADQACRSIGYPWAYVSKLIPYSESPGYVSTGEELIMREIFLGSSLGKVRWVRGQNACQRHQYELLHVECETGMD